MDQGGAGQKRHENILWLGWAFGVLQLAFMTGLLIFGARRKERPGPLALPLVIGAVLWAGVFTMLVLSYGGYMSEEAHGLFFGLPRPTAWFVYGFWPIQAFFVIAYVLAFSRHFVTEEDLERFQEILAAKARRDGGDA